MRDAPPVAAVTLAVRLEVEQARAEEIRAEQTRAEQIPVAQDVAEQVSAELGPAEQAAAGGAETEIALSGPDSAPPGDFAEFVRGCTRAMLRTAFLLTGDHHLAEDLVQSALIRTHRAWPRLSGPDHAEAYTRRAMYHLRVSWWRRRRPAESPMADLREPEPAGADETARVVTRHALLSALRRLTMSQRAVLVLRFFEDRTEAEAAAALGVSVGTIKSQTSRALARLRQVAPDLYCTDHPADRPNENRSVRRSGHPSEYPTEAES